MTRPEAQSDSYLTIGLDMASSTPGAIQSIGIDFSQWTEQVQSGKHIRLLHR